MLRSVDTAAILRDLPFEERLSKEKYEVKIVKCQSKLGRLSRSPKMKKRAVVAVFDLQDHGVDLVDDTVTSVGGLVFNRLGRLPRTGDSVDADGWRLTVEATRGTRVRPLCSQAESATAKTSAGNSGRTSARRKGSPGMGAAGTLLRVLGGGAAVVAQDGIVPAHADVVLVDHAVGPSGPPDRRHRTQAARDQYEGKQIDQEQPVEGRRGPGRRPRTGCWPSACGHRRRRRCR